MMATNKLENNYLVRILTASPFPFPHIIVSITTSHPTTFRLLIGATFPGVIAEKVFGAGA
jgi:hypothetical protein